MIPNSVAWTCGQLQRETSNAVFTLPWMAELSLKSERLDNEHHAILKYLNDLLFAIGSGDPTRIAMACDSSSAAAQAHFASEEAQMRATGFPELESHCAQHEELRLALARLRHALISGTGFSSATAVLQFLERWFIPHLTHADKVLADYVFVGTALTRIGLTQPTAGGHLGAY